MLDTSVKLCFSVVPMNAIERAVEQAGGQVSLAKAISVTPQAVNQWVTKGLVPAARCLAVETATGISRHDLRPDVFGPAPANEEAQPLARRSSAAPGEAAEADAVPVPLKAAA